MAHGVKDTEVGTSKGTTETTNTAENTQNMESSASRTGNWRQEWNMLEILNKFEYRCYFRNSYDILGTFAYLLQAVEGLPLRNLTAAASFSRTQWRENNRNLQAHAEAGNVGNQRR